MNNYWIDYWKSYGIESKSKDVQTRVLRTLNKKPISQELWEFTLNNIDSSFSVNKGDHVLDLCCGNGLLSRHFLSKGAEVTSVDVSADLLDGLKNIEGVRTIAKDIRKLDFEKQVFDKVVIYAGIQYLNFSETIVLIKQIFNWLKPGGQLFLGDIPDVNKTFDFYNTPERQKLFFDNTIVKTDVVGTWFNSLWFEKLSNHIGFSKCNYIKQPDQLIYSNFRFDLKMIK